MEHLKQFMGFILLGVVVWLLSTLGHIENVITVCAFLLVLAVACWLYGVARKPVAVVVAAALLVGGWFGIVHGKLSAAPPAEDTALREGENGIPWQPFTPERLNALIEAGTPTFIDFTASWCLNCKYNEKFVLETEPVRAAFREKQITPLKADWSNGDPAITQLLRKFGRVGVPAYVLYPGPGKEPVVLPEILKQDALLESFQAVQLP